MLQRDYEQEVCSRWGLIVSADSFLLWQVPMITQVKEFNTYALIFTSVFLSWQTDSKFVIQIKRKFLILALLDG